MTQTPNEGTWLILNVTPPPKWTSRSSFRNRVERGGAERHMQRGEANGSRERERSCSNQGYFIKMQRLCMLVASNRYNVLKARPVQIK